MRTSDSARRIIWMRRLLYVHFDRHEHPRLAPAERARGSRAPSAWIVQRSCAHRRLTHRIRWRRVFGPHVFQAGAFVFVYLGASYDLSGQTPDTRLDDAVKEIAQLKRIAGGPGSAHRQFRMDGESAIECDP